MSGMHVKLVLTLTAIALTMACGLGTLAAPAHAEDKKPAPGKPTPGTISFTHHYDTSSVVILLKTGSETPGSLEGRLHIVVETTFAAGGQVAERRFHVNLMNAFVTSLDGSSRQPATGSDSEVLPAQACTADGCPPDVWSVRFDVPKGGSFTLRLAASYDADGAIVDAGVLRPIVG